MAGLTEIAVSARVVWLGRVADRAESLRAAPVSAFNATLEGVAGETHAGHTRPSCSRVRALYPVGTEIRNTRQFSVLSAEEMAQIARAMELETLDPALLGASVVVEGIADFTHVPPSSRLLFPSGASLVVDHENGPCQHPAREIEAEAPGHGKAFMPAARGLRGVTSWVERGGDMAIGDALRLFIPDQPAWQGV